MILEGLVSESVAAGFETTFLLDLPITSLDNLFKSMLRARHRVLAEHGRTTMYATQGSGEQLAQWLSSLSGQEMEKSTIGNGDDLVRDFFGGGKN